MAAWLRSVLDWLKRCPAAAALPAPAPLLGSAQCLIPLLAS